MTRVGFFTDTSICIGCKACEVACKEWNDVPDDGLDFLAMSYDNTGALGADTWRHVAFVEKTADSGVKWLMSSDVCKHCTHAACLDVCPTGALFRTEFDTVVVQQDVCNGCGYCVPACPFGVIDKREPDGRVWKCTLCYDRLKADMTPARSSRSRCRRPAAPPQCRTRCGTVLPWGTRPGRRHGCSVCRRRRT
jgi:formate dehydrogenase iron-sulfur subunit